MDATDVVVDPIRVPDGARRAYRGAPGLARLFILLAAGDVLVRWLGVVSPAMDLDPSRPMSILTSFAPHDLLVLLPAVVVLRVPKAATLTPWILAGAVVAAAATLVSGPLMDWVVAPGTAEASASASAIVGSAAFAALTAIAWIGLGRGLTSVNPREPAPFVAGLANLIAIMVVMAAAAELVPQQLLRPVADPQDPGVLSNLLRNAALELLVTVAWAYLLRAIVRGFGDPRRPNRATWVGTLAVVLAGVLGLGFAVLTVMTFAEPPLARSIVTSPIYQEMTWLPSGGALSLIVLAFGLGLADPFSRVGGMVFDWIDPQAGGQA